MTRRPAGASPPPTWTQEDAERLSQAGEQLLSAATYLRQWQPGGSAVKGLQVQGSLIGELGISAQEVIRDACQGKVCLLTQLSDTLDGQAPWLSEHIVFGGSDALEVLQRFLDHPETWNAIPA